VTCDRTSPIPSPFTARVRRWLTVLLLDSPKRAPPLNQTSATNPRGIYLTLHHDMTVVGGPELAQSRLKPRVITPRSSSTSVIA
jgi:hypothetical protein